MRPEYAHALFIIAIRRRGIFINKGCSINRSWISLYKEIHIYETRPAMTRSLPLDYFIEFPIRRVVLQPPPMI